MLLVATVCVLLFSNFSFADLCAWDNCPAFANDNQTINLHILAHSHDDMGWLKTADDYFTGFNVNQVDRAVEIIIDTVVQALKRDPDRRFSYAEVGFLTRWLETRSAAEIKDLVGLVNNGQLELIGGGWVQPDEATSHYIELIDMYTLGSRRLAHTFGPTCSKPKTGWQIDPFGHSREHANLLAMMGHESVYFARENHLEHDLRKTQKKLEFKWWTSDENPTRNLFGGVFFAHYDQPSGMCYDFHCNDAPVIINPDFENYNADDVINRLTDYVENQRLPTLPHKHVLFMMGDDFQYQSAEQNFRNLDNLIWLVRNRTNYKIFYTTPACYTKAVLASQVTLTDKKYDFFPYGSDPNAYWTGYFTSKPVLKGLVRSASNLLNTVRTINAFSLQNLTEYTSGEEKLERAVALSQHHDAVTGTSKEHVTQDYEHRIFQGMDSVQNVYQKALQTISQKQMPNTMTFPSQTFCRLLNESICDFTSKNTGAFSILVANGHSQEVQTLIRIPVQKQTITLVDDRNNPVDHSVVPVFKNGNQINRNDTLPYELRFTATLPAVGFATYFVTSQTKSSGSMGTKDVREKHPKYVKATSITNGVVTVNFDDKNLVSSVEIGGKTYNLKQQFMYYEGHDNNGRASGAYVFRPQNNTATTVADNPTTTYEKTGLEARQVFSNYVSQIIRLHPSESFVEFEWTIGPIPERDGFKKYGKEVITRYTAADVASGTTFYTDANGRQLMKRVRNFNPDYTFENAEPVAANYYPVTSRALIKDDKTAFVVLTDRSQAASSIVDGSLEFLLHRRDFYDDGFGVDEPLNEPGSDGRGLVVRGIHRVYFSAPESVAAFHREQAYRIFNAPIISFSPITTVDDYKKNFLTKYSGLAAPLPANVKLLTLKQLDASNLLIRLEHIFAANEDAQLSKPATVDLSKIFKDLKVTTVQEMSLAANSILQTNPSTNVTLNPQDIKTFKLSVTF